MPQDTSGENLFGFDSNERTQDTGEISSRPDDASRAFALNSVIAGTYRVLEFIGEGGMGLVYRVEHILMNKILALKVLKTEDFTETLWKRFRLEALAISRLDHANIIKIYDMNQTEDGRPFYIMDLLSGQSLADYLRQNQRMPASEALPIFRQVCSALAYAHERGIIHRDIKPGNIMLLDAVSPGAVSQVKIVDFGIVKLVDGGELASQGLTRQGEVFGSPIYMSPEQCAGSKLDGRSDMYSVGVTLFQALCGKPPLLGRTASETIIMHHTVAPPAMVEVSEIQFPDELEAIVAKLLAKAPADRYSSLSEVAQALLAIESQYSSLSLVSHSAVSTRKVTAIGELRPNYLFEVETGGLDTLQLNRIHKPLLTLAAVFAVAAIAVIIFVDLKLMSAKGKPNASRPLATSINHSQNTDAVRRREAAELDAIEVSSDPESEKEIALLLKERKEPYITIGKDRLVRFSFPRKVCIGTIEIATHNRKKTFPAQGDFQIRQCNEISFTSNAHSNAHPDLLKFFPANSLDCLIFTNAKVHSDVLFEQILRQPNLLVLDLTGTSIDESDFKLLSGLKKLSILTIDTYNIGHKALLESNLFSRLSGVGLIGLRNCKPILQVLGRSKKLQFLTLTSASLTKADFALIAKMTRLTQLTLIGTKLDDSDLQTLSKLQNISTLNLFATNITTKSIKTLRKLPHLKEIVLPPEVGGVYFGE